MTRDIVIVLLTVYMCVFLFSLAYILTTRDIEHWTPDLQTIEACRHYANTCPHCSIPLERRAWMDRVGYDYINYDYYQDCINQKDPRTLQF